MLYDITDHWNTTAVVENVWVKGREQRVWVVLVGGSDDHHTLHNKCPYSELFWSAFSRIQTE